MSTKYKTKHIVSAAHKGAEDNSPGSACNIIRTPRGSATAARPTMPSGVHQQQHQRRAGLRRRRWRRWWRHRGRKRGFVLVQSFCSHMTAPTAEHRSLSNRPTLRFLSCPGSRVVQAAPEDPSGSGESEGTERRERSSWMLKCNYILGRGTLYPLATHIEFIQHGLV